MSDYFDYSTGRLQPGTTARSSEINNLLDSIDVGLAKLPSEAHIKRGLINYAAAGGTASAITVTLPYPPDDYYDGMEVIFKSSLANTGATTINVNSLGVKDIRRQDGSVLQAGDIGANKIIPMRYNETSGFFEIVGSLTEGVGTMASQNATAVAITGGTIADVTMTGGTVGTHVAAAAPHSGHETPAGAQAKVDTHAAVAAPHSGHETPAGAAAKANAVQSNLDTHADLANPHSATATPTANRIAMFNASSLLNGTFPSGTAMLFNQTSAPTGWTKSTTHNDKALRVVSGTAGSGGSVTFTSAFANKGVAGTVGNTTLTTAQMPSHRHGQRARDYPSGNAYAQGPTVQSIVPENQSGTQTITQNMTDYAGSGSAHNHSFSGTAIDMAVQYVDVIIATKD